VLMGGLGGPGLARPAAGSFGQRAAVVRLTPRGGAARGKSLGVCRRGGGSGRRDGCLGGGRGRLAVRPTLGYVAELPPRRRVRGVAPRPVVAVWVTAVVVPAKPPAGVRGGGPRVLMGGLGGPGLARPAAGSFGQRAAVVRLTPRGGAARDGSLDVIGRVRQGGAPERRGRIRAPPAYLISDPRVHRRHARINTRKDIIRAPYAPTDDANLHVWSSTASFRDQRPAAIALAGIAARSFGAKHVVGDGPGVARVKPPGVAPCLSALAVGDDLDVYLLERVARLGLTRALKRVTPAHDGDAVLRLRYVVVGVEANEFDVASRLAREKDQSEIVIGAA